jgi:hypothetical protein
MTVNDRVQFAGQIVTVRAVHNHAITGKPLYLIEFADGALVRVGAESLAPLEMKTESSPLSFAAFTRQPVKVRRVLK